MTRMAQRQLNRVGLLIGILMLAGTPAGCSSRMAYDDPASDYTQRLLTVSPTAGNAPAANTAIQTAGPWPAHAYDTNVSGNGERMVKAIQNYENRDGSGGASPTTPAGAPGASGAPPPPS